MAKSTPVAEQVASSPVVALPFFHAGFASPSASDAKGYADEKSGRTTRTLANVVITLGSKDRPSTVHLVGAAVKAMQDPGKQATISVTFPNDSNVVEREQERRCRVEQVCGGSTHGRSTRNRTLGNLRGENTGRPWLNSGVVAHSRKLNILARTYPK